MVRIRLRRVGAKNQPSYRIVVADSRSPRDGRFIEKIGFYNPRTEPATMVVDEARAMHWLTKGAQPSEAVRRILDRMGTIQRAQRLLKGESLEALLVEAEKDAAARPPVDPRTRRDVMQPQPKKTRKKAAEPAAVAEVVETVAVAEAEVAEVVAEAAVEIEAAEAVAEVEAEAPAAVESELEAAPPKPKRTRKKAAAKPADEATAETPEAADTSVSETPEADAE